MVTQTATADRPVVRYSRPAIALHWIVFVLVAVGLTAIEIRGPRGSESRALWTGVHMWCGVLILAAMILRVLWRLYRGAPAAENRDFIGLCASGMHWLLYIVLLVQPLLGILMTNASGSPVTLRWTGWTITLIGEHKDWRPFLHTAHVFIGNALFYLIALHVLAGLWHHFVLRDGTLRKMA
jgi:cytochrome b561